MNEAPRVVGDDHDEYSTIMCGRDLVGEHGYSSVHCEYLSSMLLCSRSSSTMNSRILSSLFSFIFGLLIFVKMD